MGVLLSDVALAFAFSACVASLHLIMAHLSNYTQPDLQRYIVRILWMVPVRASAPRRRSRSPAPADIRRAIVALAPLHYRLDMV